MKILGPSPTPPDELPWILEIGFGDGRFLAQLAQEHPEWGLLGVDLSTGSVQRAWKRLRKFSQVRLHHASAEFVLRQWIPPRRLYRVYVNFPDPWPKARHREHRLLRAPFWRRLSTRLQEEGALWLTTDHLSYAEEAESEALSTGLYEVVRTAPSPELLTTKYALKWRAQGREIFHVRFLKRAEDQAIWEPLPISAMPHALLRGTLPSIAAFEKQVISFPGGHVIVLELLRSLEGGYRLLTRIEEEELVQEVLLEVRPSQHGIHAGLSSFGAPLATPGTRRAVEWLVSWLETQGLELAQRSY